jgi:hypothetical protein
MPSVSAGGVAQVSDSLARGSGISTGEGITMFSAFVFAATAIIFAMTAPTAFL